MILIKHSSSKHFESINILVIFKILCSNYYIYLRLYILVDKQPRFSLCMKSYYDAILRNRLVNSSLEIQQVFNSLTGNIYTQYINRYGCLLNVNIFFYVTNKWADIPGFFFSIKSSPPTHAHIYTNGREWCRHQIHVCIEMRCKETNV